MSDLLQTIMQAMAAVWQEWVAHLLYALREFFRLPPRAEQHLTLCQVALTLVILTYFARRLYRVASKS